jgi:hypothetical protein
MRSELVYGALTYVSNRYLLVKLASKATRKLHKPNTRIQETTNDVLVRFSRENPTADLPSNGNVQPFPEPYVAQAEDHSLPDLEESVA